MKKIYTYFLMMVMAMTMAAMFTSCESDDQYEADVLISGDWQGYLGTYYYGDRWGLYGTTYETVMHFSGRGSGVTSGRGYEVDYDTRSPFRDYAYCEFQWSIVDGQITLIYDDSAWTPVYIYDYRLTHDRFAGYMDDGSRRSIQFEFENVSFGYWSRYQSGYYWDDDDYYYSRTRSAQTDSAATSASVPVVSNGKSILSGAFAK